MYKMIYSLKKQDEEEFGMIWQAFYVQKYCNRLKQYILKSYTVIYIYIYTDIHFSI